MKSLACVLSLGLFAGAVQAQEIRGFDPRKSCVEILSGSGTVDQMMIAAWTFGYLAAKQGEFRPVHVENNKVVLQNITKACIENNGASLVQLLEKSKKSTGVGSEAEARILLMRFLEPGADRAALTAALKPSEADIRAVYADPLAGKLAAMYDDMYKPGVAIGPKPDQNAVITVHATTRQLREGMAILQDFPGGYKKVLSSFKGEHPIVRFKFVTEGKTSGLAFDGLVHVNGRWVLMPKPWRALE